MTIFQTRIYTGAADLKAHAVLGAGLEPSQADSGAWRWGWLLVTWTTKREPGVFMLHPDLTQWAREDSGQVIPKL